MCLAFSLNSPDIKKMQINWRRSRGDQLNDEKRGEKMEEAK